MNRPENIVVQAPAKINLGLEVLRRRPDGFHEVNTIYAAVGLYDTVELRSRDDQQFTCMVEGDRTLGQESPEDNLCVRALRKARELAMAADAHPCGVDVFLHKRIPTGAGLGGGSADAALTMLGAFTMWGIIPDFDDVSAAAAELGSDVPFFLKGGVAQAGSRGERLHSLDLDLPWAVLLVNPGVHISTPWAYRAINRTGQRDATDLAGALRRGLDHPETLRESLANDFEDAVFLHHPVLLDIKDRLYKAGAFFALMSGSGSTMFGLFRTLEQAQAAGQSFSEFQAFPVDFNVGTFPQGRGE